MNTFLLIEKSFGERYIVNIGEEHYKKWKRNEYNVRIIKRYKTSKVLCATENTVFGNQDTEEDCETYLTDVREVNSTCYSGENANKMWEKVFVKGGVYYSEQEDMDHRSGDTTTHRYFLTSNIDDIKIEDNPY